MERLEASLCRNAEKAPEELLRAVKEDIDRFVGEAPQFDDRSEERRVGKECGS